MLQASWLFWIHYIHFDHSYFQDAYTGNKSNKRICSIRRQRVEYVSHAPYPPPQPVQLLRQTCVSRHIYNWLHSPELAHRGHHVYASYDEHFYHEPLTIFCC